MLLWLVFAAMTAFAVLAVIVPLARPRENYRPGAADAAIYRDQLDTIAADVARGLIGKNEADSARTEISRRLLAVSPDGGKQPARGKAGPARARLAMVLGSVVIAVSLGGYLLLGSPELPGQPLSERRGRPLVEQDVETLLARVESHLQQEPQDGRGWDVVAPVYLKLGRNEDAVQAFTNAIRISGSSAPRQAGLGEALVRSAGGVVTAQARAAFEAASALDPELVRPRFFLALASAQDGDTGKAARQWRALLEDAPADAPWREMVERQIAEAEGASKAPDDGGVAAADRTAMIEGMVAGLAKRLREDGDDLDGWLKLMRSYTVLGRDDEARTALADARRQFAGDDMAMRRIGEAAAQLGIKGAAQ